MNRNYFLKKSTVFISFFLVAAIVLIIQSQISAAEKLMIPIGKSVAIPAHGVKKILAVKEGIVDVLNVSDEEIILSGLGDSAQSTQLILWDMTGRRVYDIETYSENEVIQSKFSSIIGNPGIQMVIFPDSVYLKGQASSEEEKRHIEEVAKSLIQTKQVISLIENQVSAPSLSQRIQGAINIPTVKVSVVSANFDPNNSGNQNSLVGTDTANLRIILHGTVPTQNEYIHLTETVRGFVANVEQISNLVSIENPIQVVFQAYVLQVSKNNAEDLGIEWGRQGSEGSVVTGVLGWLENVSNDFRGDVQSVGAPVPNRINPFKVSNINRFDLIAAQVRAWETKGKAKVLANPKITVYANASPVKIAQAGWLKEKAETESEMNIETDSGLAYVNVGQKIFYAAGSNLSTGVANYQEANASLKLMIRDMYINNDDLKFTVFAKQEEPSFVRGSDGPPDILNRSIMTTLQIKDQQTIVLGGLINRSQSVSWKSVPGLSKIPYLGRLFKSKSVSNSENELVILLTPKIINREENLAGNSRFDEVPVPRRSDRLEKLHNIFEEIKSSHIPVKN